MHDCLRRFTRIRKAFELAALVCVAGSALSAPRYLLAESNTALVVATIDTARQLGGGATLSPDGRSLVYVGADGLHLRDLATNKDTLLKREVEFGNAVFERPRFTPNGKQVLVSVSGGTWYYPSDIYLIGIDGSAASKLTISTPTETTRSRGAIYRQYFYSAMMSPKSFDILVWVYDAAAASSSVGILESRAADRPPLVPGAVRVICEGEPLAWSKDGGSFFFSKGKKVVRYYTESQRTRELAISGTPVGVVLGSETLAVDDGRIISFVSMDSGQIVSRNVILPRSQFVATQTSPREELTLRSLQSIATGLTLLIYKGPTMERLELVKAEFDR
jgi:hypothetical protein